MHDNNTLINKARGRRDILAALVIICAATGSVYEYQQATAPLDEAVIFLSPANTVNTSEQAVSPQVESEPQIAAPDNHQQALQEFLGYMDEINETADRLLSQPHNVLDNIHTPTTVAPKAQANEPVFTEGKIEIYDSERGVVAVVDEGQPQTEEQVAPSAQPQAVEKALPEAVQAEQAAEAAAAQKVQQKVEQDVKNITDNGEEAPVVLLPGIGIPPADNAEANEEINLEDTSDNAQEIEKDIKVINNAIEEAQKFRERSESQALIETPNLQGIIKDIGIKLDNQTDDEPDDEAVNMLHQIGQ